MSPAHSPCSLAHLESTARTDADSRLPIERTYGQPIALEVMAGTAVAKMKMAHSVPLREFPIPDFGW